MKYSAPMKHIVQRLSEKQRPNTSHHAVKIKAQIRNLAAAVEGAENLAAKRDPTMPQAAHEVAIAKAARRLLGHADKANEDMHKAMAEGLTDLDNQIRVKVNFNAHPTYAPEIRQALRLMTDQQRHEVVRQALDQGDGPTMAAIMEAPQITTGLDPKQMQHYREAFEKKHATELVEQRDEMFEMFDTGLAAIRNTRSAANEGINPARLREIEQAQEQHAEATRSFESSVQSA